MAVHSIATGDAVTKKLYERKLFLEIMKESYFEKFMSESMDSIVYKKTDLMKSQGDVINYFLSPRLTGAARTESDGTLEGKERGKTTHSDSISLGIIKDAVRWNSDLTVQRASYDLPSEMRRLILQKAAEDLDKEHFDALVVTPTRVFYNASGTVSTTATAATAKSGVTASDKLDPALMMFAKTWCKTGGNRTQPPIEPVRINGRDHYVLLVHPDVAHDLKRDSEYIQSIREAERRGSEHPIFSGAIAIYDGIVIHEHENVYIATDGGSGGNVAYSECSLLGKNALITAFGKSLELVEKDFGYDEESGVAYKIIMASKKPKFNSLDFGSVGIYVARTQISDAS
jgi:N4-gp56 family major capsid protein